MANPPIGINFVEGCLGVVRITFDNMNMGKTLDTTEIEIVEDIKDIMYAQDGTQPADKIPTGQAILVRASLAEPMIERLQKVTRGVTIAAGGSASFGRDMYRSGKANFAKKLVLSRVDSDGVSSTNPLHIMTFYKAMPRVTGAMAYGPDNQKMIEVEWYVFNDDANNKLGYMGYNSSLGLTA